MIPSKAVQEADINITRAKIKDKSANRRITNKREISSRVIISSIAENRNKIKHAIGWKV